jgi:hypothetical protein
MTPSARGRLLMRLADLITANSDRLAALETRDSGKLISEMTPQVRYIAECYRYFGDPRGQNRGAVLPINKAGTFAYTRRESVGVVAAIVRWNSPLGPGGRSLASNMRRPPRRRAPRSRNRMDRQLSARQLHRAVRRLQAERYRSRKRTLVNRRVSLDQVRLDRHDWQDSKSFVIR